MNTPTVHPKMFVLLATQRSGTNMLRSVLNTHHEICALPEVFHTSYFPFGKLPDFEYYEQYRLRIVSEDLSMILPERSRESVNNYFASINKQANKHGFRPILDIKYNSLHHANMAWSNPLEPPILMDIFRARRIPVIHLRRENQLAMAISLFRAQATSQFVEEDATAISEVNFSVCPERLLNHIRTASEHEAAICKWLKRLEIPVLEIEYNNLFTDGPSSEFDSTIFNKIAEFLGVDGSGLRLEAKTKRLTTRSYREEILNFDEIDDALRGTPYHIFFK